MRPATGRRDQCFSPSPAISGNKSSPPTIATGRNQQGRSLHLRRQEGQHGIEPEEEEVGTRHGLNDGRIRLAARAKGTEEEGAGHHGKQEDCRKDGVFPRGIGHEGNAGGFGQSRVIAVIIRLAHKTPRHRPFIDSQAQNHQQVQAHEGQQQSGNQEDVQRKEARKRGAADDRPAQQEMHHGSAGERNAADDGSADAQAPVGVLIEAQAPVR